ncbi:MAG: hypothetical protein HY776_05625 [Actinobacteria bacterium]|nr:hypothetical protein [Actinomycetota bacterium]
MRNFLKYKDLSKVYLLLILIISFISLSKTAALADVLPVELTVRINSSTTSKTQIQVSTGWVGTSWMSQEGIGKSIYRIGIKSDGTVISLDGQLDFTPWPDVTDQALRMYIRYPNASSNGADALLYTKDGISVVYGNMGFVDFGNGQLTRGLTEGNGFSIANSSGNWQTWSPLPQYFLIHVPTITPSTRIQVSAYFAAKKWVSQPLLARGDYIIRVDPDGFVRSIDSKLAFTKSAEASDSALTIYTLNPLNENGADYTRYTWSKSSNAIGAISLNSSGYVNFNSGAVSSSSTGNTASTTLTKEVAYPEKFLLRVHLDSVTPWTYLHIPFYWKRVIYRSQIPLPAGDYWIQVMPDPDPNNPNTAPYLLSVDHKLIFERIYCPEAPDPVFAVFIALPKWPEQGFDTVGFIHNFRKPNTYQTMLGENKTGPDLGLGFVYADVRNPKDAITNHPTTPTETLTGGNYVVITDLCSMGCNETLTRTSRN